MKTISKVRTYIFTSIGFSANQVVLSFSGTINKDNFDSVFLWYQTTLMSSPSVHLRYLKAKDLLFTIFSVDGKLYYMTMLLALCRDDTPLMGLMKAISIVVNRNVTNDQHHNNDVDDRTNDKHSYQLSRKLLYEVLTICLKNYMVLIYCRFLLF